MESPWDDTNWRTTLKSMLDTASKKRDATAKEVRQFKASSECEASVDEILAQDTYVFMSSVFDVTLWNDSQATFVIRPNATAIASNLSERFLAFKAGLTGHVVYCGPGLTRGRNKKSDISRVVYNFVSQIYAGGVLCVPSDMAYYAHAHGSSAWGMTSKDAAKADASALAIAANDLVNFMPRVYRVEQFAWTVFALIQGRESEFSQDEKDAMMKLFGTELVLEKERLTPVGGGKKASADVGAQPMDVDAGSAPSSRAVPLEASGKGTAAVQAAPSSMDVDAGPGKGKAEMHKGKDTKGTGKAVEPGKGGEAPMKGQPPAKGGEASMPQQMGKGPGRMLQKGLKPKGRSRLWRPRERSCQQNQKGKAKVRQERHFPM